DTFATALAIVEHQPWVRTVEADMTASTGRPRVHSWTAIFVILAITAIESKGDLLLSDAERVAERLNPSQRYHLGMTRPMDYSHLESAVADLGFAFDETVNPCTGDITAPRLSMAPAEFMTSVAASFIPESIPATATQSIDSTDYEAHAARRSRNKHAHDMVDQPPDLADDPPLALFDTPDAPPDGIPPALAGPAAPRRGYPKKGANDGRYQHSVDPDAREGWRAGKNMNRSGFYHPQRIAPAQNPAGRGILMPRPPPSRRL
ncbi:MAG: hypothetical protein J2P17_30580, partial [Mycobacterium sp.]|nr:hypothetical protein [Mycobacterium sp.]